MRFGLLLVLLLCAANAHAQEQERRLIDRLLEPNSKLQNSQQHKQFTGAGLVRTASTSTRQFYVQNKNLSKNFTGTHQFATTSFRSRNFSTKEATLPAAPRTKTFATAPALGARTAADSSNKLETGQFAGSRPFLGRGKSQESLHAQDHPLSIDDIRELLNKNK